MTRTIPDIVDKADALLIRAERAEYHLAEMLGTVGEYEEMQTKCLARRMFDAAYRARQAMKKGDPK
jgi:hypothetical protein